MSKRRKLHSKSEDELDSLKEVLEELHLDGNIEKRGL